MYYIDSIKYNYKKFIQQLCCNYYSTFIFNYDHNCFIRLYTSSDMIFYCTLQYKQILGNKTSGKIGF